MVSGRGVYPPVVGEFAIRRVTSSCCFSAGRRPYLEGLFQSSTHQGHQVLGLPWVVPFLMTLIFMVLPFWLSDPPMTNRSGLPSHLM